MDELAQQTSTLAAETGDEDLNTDMSKMSVAERETMKDKMQMKSLLLEAWEGTIMKEFVMTYPPGLRGKYMQLAEKSGALVNHPWFVNFITYVIVLAGVLVGAQTWPHLSNDR